MSFQPPNFNLAVNVWRNAAGLPPVGAPTLSTTCVLFGRKPGSLEGIIGVGSAKGTVMAGFPKLTDVRGFAGGGSGDTVEIPASTGRYYLVELVDDSGKGYTNEYRYAILLQGQVAGGWPYPTP